SAASSSLTRIVSISTVKSVPLFGWERFGWELRVVRRLAEFPAPSYNQNTRRLWKSRQCGDYDLRAVLRTSRPYTAAAAPPSTSGAISGFRRVHENGCYVKSENSSSRVPR